MSGQRFGWPVFGHVWRQADLFDQVVALSGVSCIAAMRVEQGAAWRDARRKCINCLHDVGCRQRLGAKAGPMPPEFCPNRTFLRDCLETDLPKDAR